MATADDIKRVEEKLDAIIKHFGIGEKPQRPVALIRQMAREKVLQPKRKYRKGEK